MLELSRFPSLGWKKVYLQSLFIGSYTCACNEGFILMNEMCVANIACSDDEIQSCVNADCYRNQTSPDQTVPVCSCINGELAGLLMY